MTNWNESDADPLADIQSWMAKVQDAMLRHGEVFLVVSDRHVSVMPAIMAANPGIRKIVAEPSGITAERTKDGKGFSIDGRYEILRDGRWRDKISGEVGHFGGNADRRYFVSPDPVQPAIVPKKPTMEDFSDIVSHSGLIERYEQRKRLARNAPKPHYAKHNTSYGNKRRGKGRT